ncbi:hypothetical protein KFU94_12870 [Chloroflexi bacterium TSY]|nr:hypothetical protein [Chloroflexi bacterium TSY]
MINVANNMAVRNKGLSTQQTLTWNHENRLSIVIQGSATLEEYLYDDTGIRIKKWNSAGAVYTSFRLKNFLGKCSRMSDQRGRGRPIASC